MAYCPDVDVGMAQPASSLRASAGPLLKLGHTVEGADGELDYSNFNRIQDFQTGPKCLCICVWKSLYMWPLCE